MRIGKMDLDFKSAQAAKPECSAIREGVICPIGVIGLATLIAMTDDEREAWRIHFHGSQS